MRPDLVRNHGRPLSSSRAGFCRHAPGSTVSSARSVPLGSAPAAPTKPACRRPSTVLLRTGRFVAARCDAPPAASSGVAWTSPRFWSRGRIDALKSGAFGGARRSPNTCRNSAASSVSAAKSAWALMATRTRAHAERSNIHAGTSSQRSVFEPLRLQRKTIQSDLPIASWTPT